MPGRRLLPYLLMFVAAGGCISPHAYMEQKDLEWYASDRYGFADEMPAADKDEAFHKIEAYWETLEAVQHVESDEAVLNLDGRTMTREAANEHVKDRIHRTEEEAGITSADYCARAAVWTALIPLKILKTPLDAAVNIVESPVSNIEW